MRDTSSIRRQLETVRDEKRTAANTATRIGNALIALLDLFQDIDPGGEDVVTFVKGLLVGDGTYGIDEDGAARLLSIIFDEYLMSRNAISGFTDGRGIFMDARSGVIEADGLEVRGFMRIMELIINRLQLMESDYSFTEGGEIEHVDYTIDGRLILHMHKRYDNDITPFYEGDIIYAKINDLLAPGNVPDGHTATKHGSYFTSWMRVDSVNQAENTLTVSLYRSRDDNGNPIVPGGRNFTLYGSPIMNTDLPSTALLAERAIVTDDGLLGETGFDTSITVTRHGNVANSQDQNIRRNQQERQQSWVLSTTDQRLSFYWRVDQPILRDDNYALILGILPNLANLPSTRDPEMPSLYINTVFYENLHHIYYPAKVVKEDRGEWSVNPTEVYEGPSGNYTPDGSLSQAEQQRVGDGGSFTKGQTLAEPYHCQGLTRSSWLTSRLSPAWSRLTDKELLDKIMQEWHLDLETSRAWHCGSLWECIIEGTAEEPALHATGWTLLTTGTVTLRIVCSRRILKQSYFANGNVGTTLSFLLMVGDTDVSSSIGSECVTWTRQTKGAGDDPALEAADRAWNQNRGYHRLTIPVSSEDLPSNFWSVEEVQFTCTVDTDGTEQTAVFTLHN